MAAQHKDLFVSERRATDRLPIENQLHYKLLETGRSAQTGHGRTLNMSSSGILFTAKAQLPIGERVKLSVDWPAQLNERCGLKLVALGKIIRSNAETVAIQIEKYDFRTRAVATVSV